MSISQLDPYELGKNDNTKMVEKGGLKYVAPKQKGISWQNVISNARYLILAGFYCGLCKTVKVVSEFARNPSDSNYQLDGYCKSCRRTLARIRYAQRTTL